MLQFLLSHTALPNLHPALVHFPIALLMTAFAVDVACLVLRRQRWLDRTATLLYVLGAIAAGATYLAGQKAAESLVNVPSSAQPAIYDHEDAAFLTLVFFAVVALFRLLVWYRDRRAMGWTPLGPFRLLVLAAALVGQFLIARTADKGGALVYRDGVAVSAPAPAPTPTRTEPAATPTPLPSPAPSPSPPAQPGE
ncbi:MAG: hypothetical protein LJE95_06080 [Acidobacteria bacterium]|jgi:uncharacterized membrane protein|nr:hypothetical protein [Acidobacteriota bacterium]